MDKYFLAIDIGASSGRHILGSLQDGKIVLEEVYRFWNGMDNEDGMLCWNVERLFNEIITGMKKCREIGKIPESVGIDTWGVDYVLLDQEGNMLGKAVGYRDHRTDNMDQAVYEVISEEDLYARTGIQKAIYNTVYQLMALKKQQPEYMEKASAMLMIPDYFHYRLCGSMVQEYSEATTSQLLNPVTKDWDYELIEMLGYNKSMFQKIHMPGTAVGSLTEEVKALVGYDCQVVLPPTHDTASAVMSVPSNEADTCYISSGTWSLMGVERANADCSKESKRANFTNEGGYNGRITYLTNIMGLWMIQSVRGQLAPDMSYGELCGQASGETIASIVDCQDDSFLSPDDMVAAIQDYCRRTEQAVPETLAELACVVYNSLAKCYAEKLKEIEHLTGKKYDRIHIIGGGSNAVYLNELTAKYTGIPVYAGPGEATAIGNILTQMIQDGTFCDLTEARACVAKSFEIQIYK
ncbi:rhamnulokinase [bacterium C-53]|nr:rhamnulokinase [Lachnospiraceae bacterium]NBI03438.1 rhamnulokinase [Lachnospiraceae bacterium]RKJ09678.1 rhamnulokinase [bacterium C-53]